MNSKYLHIFIMTALIFSTPSTAIAVQESAPISGDPRIHQFVFKNNSVYRYVGHYRYASIIEFERGEDIITIMMGDSTRWDIKKAGSRIYLKPIEQDAETNMTIITSRRIYFFELSADEAEDIRDDEMVFIARFKYPEGQSNKGYLRQYASMPSLVGSGMNSPAINSNNAEIMSTSSAEGIALGGINELLENDPDLFNFNYSITGSRLISPLKIFDDGDFTYMEFRKRNSDIPAIFSVDSEGNEALVNYRMEEGYIVIEKVAQQFTLRYGKDITCVFNEIDFLGEKRIYTKKREKIFGLF